MSAPRARSLLVAAFVIAVDQLTKWWALTALDPARPTHVVWTLQFNVSYNSGMAFSRGRGLGPLIGVAALVIIVVLVLKLRAVNGALATVASGLVIGGALGNICDRIFRSGGFLRGEVVDFIDLQWWPVFNVADMAVTIGGVLLVFAMTAAAKRA
ncbi:MAG: signal peptidase II [Acidimicrobiales bacterium]